MKVFPSSFIALGVLVGAAIAVLFMACSGGGQDDPDDPRASPVRVTDPNPLLVDARTRLSICVDVVGGASLSTEQLEAAEDALADGLARTQNLPPEYDDQEVVGGCPVPAAELGTGAYDPWLQFVIVTTASEHRVFVYFVPDDLYAATFGAEPYATGVEEFMCEVDSCSPATHGVYIPLTAERVVLEDALLKGLTLLPQAPLPNPDYGWEVCEQGQEPTNPGYTCDDYWENKSDVERDLENAQER